MSDLDERLVDALRVILGRKGVLASIDDHQVKVYLSPERHEAQKLVQSLESIAEQDAALGVAGDEPPSPPYDNPWYTFHVTADYKTCDKCGMKWPCDVAKRDAFR